MTLWGIDYINKCEIILIIILLVNTSKRLSYNNILQPYYKQFKFKEY